MAAFDGGARSHAAVTGNSTHYLGAVAALAIFAGLGFWSYELIKRDVSGIPVVRAVEGTMRALPENPGGEIAMHSGLSVNEVAAQGGATELGDQVVLAPPTTQLSEDDLVLTPTAEADEIIAEDLSPEARPTQVVADTDAVLPLATDGEEPAVHLDLTSIESLDDIEKLAAELAEGVPTLDTQGAEVVPPVLALDGAPAIEIIAKSIPGVKTSFRPTKRPANLQSLVQVAVTQEATPAVAAPAAPKPAQVAPGTHLVQLGAYPTESDAMAAWGVLQAQFGDFLVSKEQLVQAADSGGDTFFRLRALGFDDLSDARRFCAALDAGGADCIPVVVR